jgi:DNA repair protein RadC
MPQFFVRDNDTAPLREIPGTLKRGTPILTATDASVALHAKIGKNKVESFLVAFLDNANRIIKTKVMSTGTEDQTAVYPKAVAREALLSYSTGILVAHNHPSGEMRPSPSDLHITREIGAALKALDIRFLDHVIVGPDSPAGYYSFRENGLLL